MIILLDTAVLIDVYRNQAKALEKLNPYSNYEFAISVFSYAEFLAGAKGNNKVFARKFLSVYMVVNFTAQSHSVLKKLSMQHELPSKHLADFLIASTAIANKYTFITPNYKDFTKFKGLKLIQY